MNKGHIRWKACAKSGEGKRVGLTRPLRVQCQSWNTEAETSFDGTDLVCLAPWGKVETRLIKIMSRWRAGGWRGSNPPKIRSNEATDANVLSSSGDTTTMTIHAT